MNHLVTVMAVATPDGDDETLGNVIRAALESAGAHGVTVLVLTEVTLLRPALEELFGVEAVDILERGPVR